MEPPLPLSTPLLLVKPPVGLSTPAVFRALDLGARSTADPQQLLSGGPRLLSSKPGFSGALCTVQEDTQQLLMMRCLEFVWTTVFFPVSVFL